MDAYPQIDDPVDDAERRINVAVKRLDAETGGLAVAFDLIHAGQACADTVVIPTSTLHREGVQALLTDAIDAAHAKRP